MTQDKGKEFVKGLFGMPERRRFLFGAGMLLFLAVYVSGLLCQIMKNAGTASLNPVRCLITALFSLQGWRTTLFVLILFAALGAWIIFQGKQDTSAGHDAERNFQYSSLGTYGTSGYMSEQERSQVLRENRQIQEVDGIILGQDLKRDTIISLPKDSPLNRNIAVCGSQGSMKSRAFARNMILQCVRRGESMFITDPKSELYEDTAAYLQEQGYTVRRWNLIHLENSDAWDCLAEIDGGSLIDTFVDVVIRNTTDKFDHFYDNTEMDLLKALCLYVYHEYEEENRTFAEAYKLLINQSLETLDGIFDRLPSTHPAKGPYRLFSKAEKVKGNAVLGLGTRLQIMQNEKVQKVTSYPEIDLTLPGKEKCAYFCITSDQDSTYDVLATLFVSFLCIKLVRFADSQPDRKLPVTVHFILDEFPNIGVVPDFKKKLATARSRALGMSIIFQNIPQLQNRYPDGQWEEILGGCDISLFLGCNDMTTATYYSERSGDVTVGVSSIRKNLSTMRMSDYVPDYSESSSVGKRKLLLPDEVLRFPWNQALVIIRGQKVLRIRKFDYSRHPEAGKLVLEKTEEYVPEWRKREYETEEETLTCGPGEIQKEENESCKYGEHREQAEPWGQTQETAPDCSEDRIERVEDLFTDDW